MMQCNSCKNVDGPFIVDVGTGLTLCEDCYEFKDVVDRFAALVKRRAKEKKLAVIDQVILIDSIEGAVLDELGLR